LVISRGDPAEEFDLKEEPLDCGPALHIFNPKDSAQGGGNLGRRSPPINGMLCSLSPLKLSGFDWEKPKDCAKIIT
jgi:hypothetical protein